MANVCFLSPVFYFLAKSYIDSLDEEDAYEEPLFKPQESLSHSLLPNSK